jgi:LacI family transcriptional regulator
MAPAKVAPEKPRIPVVAVFVETWMSWGQRVVSGIIEFAKINGPWHVELHTRGHHDVAALPRRWKPDGIIARVATPDMAERLAKTRAPIVNCSAVELPGTDFPRVITPPESQAKIAVDFFLSRGFTNFAYVGRPEEAYVHHHFSAFKRLLKEHRLACALHPPTHTPDELIAWLRALPKPVALFCWGPAIGHMVLDACFKAGINVPNDVAVLGGDFDELHSEASYPEQSGIRIAAEEVGRVSAGILQAMMRGQRPAKKVWSVEPIGIIERLSTETTAVPDPKIGAVMRFILERAHRQITVEDILRAHPMARRSLERKFRKYFGCSVVEQIRQVRVNKMRHLLAGTDEPITLLAERCGFSSYKYMGLVFSQATGMTPREYRARNRIKPAGSAPR